MYYVMIADDEQLMREAMKLMVSRVEGFQVVSSVSSGTMAVEACRKEKVDLAFLDIMMPGLSGIDACREISRVSPGTVLYIVSAYKTFEFAREAMKAQVKEYLTKPVSCCTIEALLNNFAESNKTYSKVLEGLYEMLKARNFKRMYYRIPEIVEEICQSCGHDPGCVKNIFLKIGENLSGSLGWDSEKKEEYGSFFTRPEFTFSQTRSLEFWLFGIMNDAFQQFCVKKYPVMGNVFHYVDGNIDQEIGLDEIVAHCNISQGYLSRIFMQQMKVSALEYIHMRKLMVAKQYFSFTGFSVAEVAYRLGYNESSYFSKVFKKYENMTIFQYKKALEGEREGEPCGEG